MVASPLVKLFTANILWLSLLDFIVLPWDNTSDQVLEKWPNKPEKLLESWTGFLQSPNSVNHEPH